ncbi:MAG TPA: hypothetical protein VJC09_03015 [Candidatus Saccharimonadales bacterium]|nr:hypothetical protein [Candidatus Saccharimonadales bacterium]
MFHKKQSTRQRRPIESDKKSRPVFSYYSQRPSSRASDKGQALRTQMKKANSRPWWHFAPSIIATGAIGISLIYTLGLSTHPKVTHPEEDSLLLQPSSVYEQAAQTQFASSWLNRSKLTVNAASISSSLMSEFPELEDVSITLPLIGHRPVVFVVPSSLVIVLNSKSGNFLLNQQGRAVSAQSKSALLATNRLPVVTDQSGLEVKSGRVALPGSYIGFVSTVVTQLRAKDLAIESLTLPPRSFELNVRIVGQPYTIKMNLQNDAREQIGTYLAAQQKLIETNQLPSSYFDVRVPGRIYYK